MSRAAPSKATVSGGYDVGRPQGRCCICEQVIEPGQKFVGALVDVPGGFQRADCCLGCWPKHDRATVVAFWQTVMPSAEQKKKPFVDDAVLCELFERLADVHEQPKLNFRFVLGLILMRKRLLVYETTRQENGRELWSVRMKGRDGSLELLNPKLNEEQVKEVSEQLGEILNQET